MTLVAIVAAAVYAGYSWGGAGKGKGDQPTTPKIDTSSVPALKSEQTILQEEKAKLTKGAGEKRRTIRTGPQGLLEPATVSKKVLLGE